MLELLVGVRMATAMEGCERARKTVNEFCKARNLDSEKWFDPEMLRRSFFHIYYCTGLECCERWWNLNQKETNEEVRNWIDKWKDNSDTNIILGVIC